MEAKTAQGAKRERKREKGEKPKKQKKKKCLRWWVWLLNFEGRCPSNKALIADGTFSSKKSDNSPPPRFVGENYFLFFFFKHLNLQILSPAQRPRFFRFLVFFWSFLFLCPRWFCGTSRASWERGATLKQVFDRNFDGILLKLLPLNLKMQ